MMSDAGEIIIIIILIFLTAVLVHRPSGFEYNLYLLNLINVLKRFKGCLLGI